MMERLPDQAGFSTGDKPRIGRQRSARDVSKHSQFTSVHRLFEHQAEVTPDAIAAISGNILITYRDLDARANKLAQRLRDQAIGLDQRVAVYMQRSVEMILAILAILKAGAGYVPLDPNYPVERLRYIMEDSAATFVLLREPDDIFTGASVQTIIVDDGVSSSQYGGDSNSGSISEIQPDFGNLLYVIYTSGSTGRPKGTSMAHRCLVNLMEWHRHTFHSHTRQRVLQFAALSFDVAFQEIFSTLCFGGTLVLVDEPTRTDPQALLDLLNRESVTRLFVPPLMLQSIAEFCVATGTIPRALQDVITAGEQLRMTVPIRRLFGTLRCCKLHNHYGPTETHVVTSLTLDGDPESWPQLPAIGKAISNAQIYVLSAALELLDPAESGEIYVGGVAVARGYLGRPDLTAERFLSDPFSETPGGRLYRTGDLGRWRSDGTLEYLGRNDQQVKIRGYRIEFGEIETQLCRHDRVKDAAVVTRGDGTVERHLIAYVTKNGAAALSPHELRAHLSSVLPTYMIPSAFVVLDQFPLSPNGKLDRRALPAPTIEAYAYRQYEAPRGDVETMLAALWEEILRVSKVGRHDNFFELGGNSLAEIALITRLAETLHSRPAVVSLFKYPTVERMAELVASMLSDGSGPPVVAALEVEEGFL